MSEYPEIHEFDGSEFVRCTDFDRVTAELQRLLDHKEQQRESELRNGQAGDRLVGELQQRLTAADERVDVLEREVDRLKGISDNYCSLLMDTNSRLSAADFATAAIKAWTDETRQSVLESFQEELNESASYEWYDNAISDLIRLVSALKPAEPAKDEHVCTGCGSKGWTANCKECVPY